MSLETQLEAECVLPDDAARQGTIDVASALKTQQRLNGYFSELEYNEEGELVGGSIRCKRLSDCTGPLPFAAKNVSVENGVRRVLHVNDLCNFKLSQRRDVIRATSIRPKQLKQRQPGPSDAAVADAQQQANQMLFGDSPLNSLEYGTNALVAPVVPTDAPETVTPIGGDGTAKDSAQRA